MLQSLLSTTSLLLLSLPASFAQNFTNPVLYEDYPDNDVSVGPDGAFYFSASNFHYSPGAPTLRSLDLVNWEPIGHSLPRLTFGDGYDLNPGGNRNYRGGTWASSLRYRPSTKTWYWIGCVNFWVTYVFIAPSATGPWKYAADFGQQNCYYDNGILIDDDAAETMYVVSGNPQIRVAQLAPDGLSVARVQDVFKASDVGAESMEGSRMYKINGTYYILNVKPGSTTYIWKSQSPWGPYEYKILVDSVGPPVPGGSSPHQGSLVKTAKGDWYFMSFTWAYPAGRMPVLAPIKWGADGYPTFVNGANNGWGESYPRPLPATPLYNWTRKYDFKGTTLPPTFEWNHNPDLSNVTINNGITLRTASVTPDIYSARNTLTHRIHGERPVGTVEIDFSAMADGDRFGFAAFRDQTAYIGIHRSGANYTLVAWHNATLDEWSGSPVDPGYIAATGTVPKNAKKVWFKAELDARAVGTQDAVFKYSFNGKSFTKLGPTYKLYRGWGFFIAYRFGIFNFATKALGGAIKVISLTVA